MCVGTDDVYVGMCMLEMSFVLTHPVKMCCTHDG